MKTIYIDHIDENCYSKIFVLGDNLYTIETNYYICTGYYKNLHENKFSVRLDKWYDKKTKRSKGKSNKLFQHTQDWFAYMVEKGLNKFNEESV